MYKNVSYLFQLGFNIPQFAAPNLKLEISVSKPSVMLYQLAVDIANI